MKKGLAMLMALVLTVGCFTACSRPNEPGGDTKAPDTKTQDETKPSGETQAGGETGAPAGADFSKIKIGAIVNTTKADGGFCQKQYEGLSTAMKNLGMDVDTQLVFMEQVPEEGADSTNAMTALINEGCNMIFGQSSGYRDAIDALAPSHPDVQFAQFNGSVADNTIGYGSRDYQTMFLCGYISALMSEKNELGYSAGMPEASVVRGINAFAVGAKYANPDATVQVVWANSWYDPAAEKECANSLIAKGITCIGINASSPAIAQACEEAGVYCTGYHLDMKSYAPKAVMVSFMWNWTPIFEDIIAQFAEKGKPYGEYYFWGADKECAQISDVNTDIVPQEIADKVKEAYDKVVSGEIDVFGGELKDNKGNVLVPAGETMSDEKILQQGFFVDNVIGTLP